jgi:ligand-binding SRPBCC domain-containing protein
MHILFRHPVAGTPQEVFSKFNGSLLGKLKPFYMRFAFHRYDGEQVGDRIEVSAWMLGIFRQDWVNHITERVEGADRCWFVDEGIKMPSGMTQWRHCHIVERHGTGSAIVDDITFTTGKRWRDWLLYPGVWITFRIRRRGYVSHFGPQ